MFGLGCFWGAERKFWQAKGVYSTAVGYAAGVTPNPTYEEVCSGMTGHNEVVRVVFDPKIVSYEALLKTFWESHDPTQGMRQGGDIGTQYRSGIYATNAGAAQGGGGRARRLSSGADEGGQGPNHDRDLGRAARSITPRTIISSIWTRIRAAIAAWAAQAFRARSASGVRYQMTDLGSFCLWHPASDI